MRRVLCLAALLAFNAVAQAQDPGRAGRASGRRGAAQGDSARLPPPPAMRAARQALERLVRTQVRPTPAQLQQLRAVDGRYEVQRMQLNREEAVVRGQLRALMLDTANIDQGRIAETHGRLLTFPARRAALLESEQRELAAFLTPLQRARYHAIQEQVRRQIERGRGGPPPSQPAAAKGPPKAAK